MIASLTGVLGEREGDSIIVHTDGGVGYAVTLPLGAAERLPAIGMRVTLFTDLVVKEDGWSLYGFDRASDRSVFQRLLSASGVGPRLALAVLSSLGAERTVRSIQTRDIGMLSTVNGVGKKKAERLVVELQDKFKDVFVESSEPRPQAAEGALRALVALGYNPAAADDAVRAALGAGAPEETSQLIRRALQQLAASRSGR